MSKLKNTFGLPDSLIQAASHIHETSHNELKGNQHKIDVAEPKGKITAADFDKLRAKKYKISPSKYDDPISKSRMKKESSEMDRGSQLNELNPGTYIKYASSAQADLAKRPGEQYPKRLQGIATAIKKASQGPIEIIKNSYEPETQTVLEYDYKANQQGQYPFSASQLTPMFAMIRTLLDFVQRTPALKKLMRDETGLDDLELNPVLNFLEALNEEIIELDEARGRPKGSKNKAKISQTSSSVKTTADDEEEDEPQEDAYKPASGKDQAHIMTQLKGAMDDETGGRHIDTSQGKKYVKSDTAKKIHDHLLGLKAPERAESSSSLYNLTATHPMTKHIQDDHRESVQKGIKVPGEKKGRGRPKKESKNED